MDLSRALPFFVIFKIGLIIFWAIFGVVISSHPSINQTYKINMTEYQQQISNLHLNGSEIENKTLYGKMYSYSSDLIDIVRVITFTYSNTFEELYDLTAGRYLGSSEENAVMHWLVLGLKIADFIIWVYIAILILSRLLPWGNTN
jgi:hypothetical protein